MNDARIEEDLLGSKEVPVCFKVIGNDVTVSMAAEAGQLRLNVMEPVIEQSLFESANLLTNACQSLRVLSVDGITANPDVCQSYVMNSIGIVTFLNPIIGHHNGDLVGKECARSGKNVHEVVLDMGLLTKAELDENFSPENLMRPLYRKVYEAQNTSAVLAGDAR
jgi:aspartate ammonia-lyase